MKKFLAFGLLCIFSVGVIASHSYASAQSSEKTCVVKAKYSGMDQVFMCTADVPSIFVEAPVTYAPAKNVVVIAPTFEVEPSGNSPPGII